MKTYHKIQTVYKRNPEDKHKSLLIGQYSEPEFEYLQNNRWVFTEKVDGTNIRVQLFRNPLEPFNISFGGKTDNASIPAFLVDYLNKTFLPKNYEEIFPDSGEVCLYGEGYGAKIQKGGGNYRPDQAFVLFDIKIGDWWLKRGNVVEIAMQLGIDVVPIVGIGTLHEMIDIARTGFTSKWGPFKAEGLVARPEVELKTRAGHRIITKIKCKDFVS